MCLVWSLLIPNLQYRLTTNASLRLQALIRPWALSPPLSSWALTYLTTDEVNPAQIGRFTPSSDIPNTMSSSEDYESETCPESDKSALLVAQVKLPREFEI